MKLTSVIALSSTTSIIINTSENNEQNFKQATDSLTNNDNYWTTAMMIQVVGRPILIVLGTIGNCLAFVVIQRGSLREVSTCFYMAILAVNDTGTKILPLILIPAIVSLLELCKSKAFAVCTI